FGTIAVSPSGSSRERWAQSFVFWPGGVGSGDQEFKVTITSNSGTFYSDTADDHVWTGIKHFYPDVHVNVYGLVWRATDAANHDGTVVAPAAPWSDFIGHWEYVSNVYPVTSFYIQPLPGIGMAPPNPQTFSNLTAVRAWADEELGHLGPDAR